MTFAGFSTDGLIGLPPELFTEVLPAATLPSEVKVTLHIFYRMSRQRGFPRRISWDELANDQTLCQSLRAISKLRPPEDLLEEGLDAAIQRTTLLHLAHPSEGRIVNWYMVNTTPNRAWIAQHRENGMPLAPNLPASAERPSLLALYEANIGLITPLLLEELREADERYPRDWIEAAIREAVRSNVRSWRYIRKVLERWATNGRHNAPSQLERQQPIDIEKYTSPEYGGLFRLGSDTSDL